MPWPKWPIVWLLGCLVVLCQPYVPLVGATDITISGTFHFRDHRGPNSVTTTGDVDTFGANSVIPSGAGTTAVATQGGTARTLGFFPFTQNPNTYASSLPFNVGLAGSWTITATDAAGPVSAVTNNIPNPELLPLVTNLHVIGNGVTPIISWTLPDLSGLGVDREQVRVYDVDRTVFGTIKDIIFTSAGLPVGTESFNIPNGLLHVGGHYVFDVLLDDRVSPSEGPVFTQNRSETFTQTPFSPVPEPSTLGLLIFGAAALLRAVARRGHSAK